MSSESSLQIGPGNPPELQVIARVQFLSRKWMLSKAGSMVLYPIEVPVFLSSHPQISKCFPT